MEAFIPEFYYTPKTYGIEGLRFKGFELDNLLSAGANLQKAEDVPKSTWGIFKYHMKRSILLGMLNIVSTTDDDPVKKADGTILDLAIILLNLLTNVVAWLDSVTAVFNDIMDWVNNVTTWIQDLVQWLIDLLPFGSSINKYLFRSRYSGSKSFASLIKSFSSPSISIIPQKKRVPSPINPTDAFLASKKSIALVIQPKEYITPPPPLMPNEKERGKFSAEQISAITAEIKEYERKESEFLEAETNRLVEEAALMIYWSFVLNLQHITLFENNAYLSGNSTKLIDAVKRKFQSTNEKMPNMIFAVPSQKTLYDVIGGTRVSLRSMEMLSSEEIARDAQQRFPHTPTNSSEDEDLGGPHNVKLKVVVLDRKNGKSLTMKALRYTCKLVQEKKLLPINVEHAMVLYLNQFHITPFQAVVIAGYQCSLEGLPPLSVRQSIV